MDTVLVVSDRDNWIEPFERLLREHGALHQDVVGEPSLLAYSFGYRLHGLRLPSILI